jgi:ABC-type amino acid transport system permease subunit
MDVIKGANLALRFLLEVGAVVAFGYWGFKAGDGRVMKILLGIGIPLLVVIMWTIFVSPNAAVSLPDAVKVIVGLVILEGAAVALAGAGQSVRSAWCSGSLSW